MPLPHQFRKELQEESHQQHPDMHAIHIGIRCNNNVVITKIFISVFDVQSRLQQVELFVLINNLLGETETIQRLAFQTEYSLCGHIPAWW